MRLLVLASSVAALLTFGAPVTLHAQQPDSAARADSIRADSIRADSVRRAELARIFGEPRAGETPREPGADPRPRRGGTTTAQGQERSAWFDVVVDMIADLSPDAAARADRAQPPRLRFNDVEAGAGARVDRWVSLGLIGRLDERDRLALREAAATLGGTTDWWRLRVGRFVVPLGREATLHRHELSFPSYSRGIEQFVGPHGSPGTGLLAMARRSRGVHLLSLSLGAVDRLGVQVDSLNSPEPLDQSLLGLWGTARVDARTALGGFVLRGGWSGATGKREQPIVCVYQTTVGPVPCPNGINAGNTRITLVGLDGEIARGRALLRGEWMRMIVGVTDLPAFENPNFAPSYQGVVGTYDASYVLARVALASGLAIGARGEFVQNPTLAGADDGSAGAFVEFTPRGGIVRFAGSYERRLSSAEAEELMSAAEREGTDRVVLRATIGVPGPWMTRGRMHGLGEW